MILRAIKLHLDFGIDVKIDQKIKVEKIKRATCFFFFFSVENKRSVSLKGKRKGGRRHRKREESWEVGVAYKLLTFNLNQVGREKFSRAHRSKSSYKKGWKDKEALIS